MLSFSSGCALGSALLLSVAAHGSVVMLDASMEMSGGETPRGPTPWVTATLTDVGTNQVLVNFSTANLVGSEFVSEWCLNVDPAIQPESLQVSPYQLLRGSGGTISNISAKSVNAGHDGYKADGAGRFDLEFDFPRTGSTDQRFGSDESLQFTIEGLGLTANSFTFFSTMENGPTGYVTAAHVQSIDGTGSGWVATTTWTLAPEPSALVLLLISPLAMLKRRRE